MNKILMTGNVEIHAAGEETGLKRFDVTAYTGGLLRVKPYPLPVVIDLAGLENEEVIVANLDHDPTQRVGHIESVTNDGKELILHGPVSATGSSAIEFVTSANNKFPWRASIEAAPTVEMQHIPVGKQVTVNGQTLTGPFLLASKSVLTGVAFLSRPADANTRVSLAAAEAAPPLEKSDMDFETWLAELGVDPANVSEEQMAKLKAIYEQENTEEVVEEVPVVDAMVFDPSEIRAAASDHYSNLEVIYAGYEDVKPDKLAEIRASASTASKQLKAKALKEKWSTPKYEGECIRASAMVERDLVRAERPAGPAIHASRVDTNATVIEAALCQTLGMPNIEKQFNEKTLDAAHTAFKGRLGLQQALIMAAEGNGYRCQSGERIGTGNLKEVLRHAFPIHAASTISLPGIFSNLANKELVAGYLDVDQSWREVAAVKSVTDFKQVSSYRLLDNLDYEELSPNGHIAHGTVAEETYSRQVKTYAKIFALTRTDIVNDDLGAFDDLRTRLGRGAAKKFNDIFWTRFLANSGFFTAGRGNYITGASTNLGVDGVGLELAITAFRKLTTPDGKRIGGRPELLIVPPELEFTASKLYQSANVNNVKTDEANIHANKYRPVVVDWLSDPSYSGYSSTAWYLLRTPAELPAIVVSFLNGQQTPTVDSADADFDQLGVQFRGYHDFGADLAEYLCGVKSKGIA